MLKHLLVFRFLVKAFPTCYSNRMIVRATAFVLLMLLGTALGAESLDKEKFLGPIAVEASKDGKRLFVANKVGRSLMSIDLQKGTVLKSLELPSEPTDMALSPEGKALYVTCAAAESTIAVIDTEAFKIVRSIPAGHTACGPSVSPDGSKLYVCNRFNDEVVVIDIKTSKPLAKVKVTCQPIDSAVTPDGRHLVVANHQPLKPANGILVQAVATVIDCTTLKATPIELPDGAINCREVCITSDSKQALITHGIGNYTLVTSQVNGGWINTAAMSVIDIDKKEFDCNTLLDSVFRGAANPWGLALADNGKTLCIAQSGTHDVSIIDMPAMLKEIRAFIEYLGPLGGDNLIEECRRRVKLPGNGPRDMVVIGSKAYVAEHFSDTIAVVDLANASEDAVPGTIRLSADVKLSLVRRGEMLFHDARLCYEEWQSCASCHADGRADALNWDLLNDGGGSPRNTKSLLYAHKTPPSMALGVRETAKASVIAGIEHILFADEIDDDHVEAIYAYVKSLKPLPSPHLVKGELSEAARRGKRIFNNTACRMCHSGPLYTDCRMHTVVPSSEYGEEKIDTPTLIELWRTPPYLNDGRYTNLQDLFIKGKHGSSMGDVEKLTKEEVDDLAKFLLSL